MLTRNGCLMEFATSNIRFSASRDSTSSRTMMSPFFKALMAKYSPVLRYLANITWKTTGSHVSLGLDMGGSYDKVFSFFWSVYLPEVAPSENGAKVERVDSHGWVRAKHRRCSHRSGKIGGATISTMNRISVMAQGPFYGGGRKYWEGHSFRVRIIRRIDHSSIVGCRTLEKSTTKSPKAFLQ